MQKLTLYFDEIFSMKMKRVTDICTQTTIHFTTMMRKLNVASTGNRFLEKATEFVKNTLFDDCSIDKFAQEMYMSKSTLYRIIMKMTGEPPLTFIRNVKMNRAVDLLLNSQLTVKEIAYSCGFNDPKYFTRCFRKEFGVTPKQYRKGKVRTIGFMWNGFNLN